MSISPSQNSGTATPATDTVVSALSTFVPRRRADTTPTGIEIRMAIRMAVRVSSSVFGSRSAMWAVTLVPSIIERPKSPWTMFQSQRPYCTHQGWSSPYSWRRASTVALESRGSSEIPGT